MLSSVARKALLPRREAAFLADTQVETITVSEVNLEVHLNLQSHPSPLVIIVPGWLGNSRSSYVLSNAKSLFQDGYSIARINLRDHGDTAHLNSGLFNSALIDEVVALTHHLSEAYGQMGTGLVGYSLGGNFALRLARAIEGLPVLAICPAIEPGNTMHTIDANVIYQRYFVSKWRTSWAAKQGAFPELYDFSQAMKLNTVSALTDYFVTYHSDFTTTKEYFDAYDLSGAALEGVHAHILAAKDDPIIPYQQYSNLPGSLTVTLTDKGGHGAYLQTWDFKSWVDGYTIKHFNHIFDRTSNR